MKNMHIFLDRLRGFTHAITRYPITTVFLLAATITNAIRINNSTNNNNTKLLLVFLFGAVLGAVFQASYERFFQKVSSRLLFMGAAVVLSVVYYFTFKPDSSHYIEIKLRTIVALFLLFLALIWVPVIKSRISFNKSFMVTFKAFFSSLFFFGVLFIGISIIIGAINRLLFILDYNAYAQSANVIFLLFAPLYFLSRLPEYPGVVDNTSLEADSNSQEDIIASTARCPKFLEILICYIIIPLIAIFTLILIIYLIRGIRGEFWTNNLLEPMLISYSAVVLLVYILVSELVHPFAVYFRRIFPKVLVPIVVFQLIASLMNLSNEGIVLSSYFTILYGIFATVAGILLSVLPVRKNGILAILLIGFSIVSIVPPFDAFSMSRTSQTTLLKNVLLENNMLENNIITANPTISANDKLTISKAVGYLTRMEYTEQLTWLNTSYNANDYDSFYKTFGFYEGAFPEDTSPPIYLSLEQPVPIVISGNDLFIQTNIFVSDISMGTNGTETKLGDIELDGKKYSVIRYTTQNQCDISVIADDNQELIRFHTMDIFDAFFDSTNNKGMLSLEQATFSTENALAKITLVVQTLNIEKRSNPVQYNGDLYVLVKIK